MADISTNQGTNQESSAPEKPDAEAPKRTRYREAYQQILQEAQAIETENLLFINIDVTAAVTTARGALPQIVALRDRASKLPDFNLKQFDTLETYALATMHVQGEYIAASTPPEALQALNEQGVALREVLHSDATALAKRGLMSGQPLKSFKVSPGYKVLAEDLVGLSSLIRHSWDAISSKTAITMAELDLAEDISERLLAVVGTREQAPAVLAEVALARQRVFTLFVAAYHQARRAISYLRWEEGDLDTIAPSLYAGRSARKKAALQPTVPAASTPPLVGSTSPLLAPLGTSPITPLGGSPSAPATAPAPFAVGLPGSSPFTGS